MSGRHARWLRLLLCAMACAVPRRAAAVVPVSLACAPDGTVLVLDAGGRRALIVDPASGARGGAIDLPAEPSGVAISGQTAFVTTAEPAGRILLIDLATRAIRDQWRAGHMPMAPTVGPDGRTLCIANRFENVVRLVDLASGAQRPVAVIREPVATAFSPDGRLLFVANHIPEVEPSLDDENPDIAAVVSVIETATASVAEHIRLPNGSHSLRDIAISPDGKSALIPHVLSNYMPPPLSPEGGAVNMNVISLVDTETLEWTHVVPVDDPDRGAANPWAIAFARGGRLLLVTHAGTHELSVIDFPALRRRLASMPRPFPQDRPDLRLLDGIRRRLALGVNGPRDLAVAGDIALAAGYFSGELAVLDLAPDTLRPRLLRVGETAIPSPARLGEAYFNDATLGVGGWQSCASCHPDGRSDTLYWDLMNDGAGNTKNTKSLLMSALASPVMWRGVREDAATAVRSGFHHILGSKKLPPGAEAAILAYLREMPEVPSPFLDADRPEAPQTEDPSCAKCHRPTVTRGSLTKSARRGKALFEGKAGCVTCHPHPLFTTARGADPGLGSGVPYRIPSLIETWRTAPYLHAGDATSIRETITDFNFMHKRGQTKNLTPQELDDLIEYVRSL